MRFWSAVALAALVAAPAARAHELACSTTVDGRTFEEISRYPTTLHYSLTVSNRLTTQASVVESETDALLESLGFDFDPAPTFSLDVGASTTYSFDVPVASYEDCLALAAKDGGTKNDALVDETFTVGWDESNATCEAELRCMSPTPLPSSSVTRTVGFWKTHPDALDECIGAGPVDLGALQVTDLSHALGLFWGSPARYSGGGPRSDLDRARFETERQLLAGICNFRLFGTFPNGTDLFHFAQLELSSNECTDIARAGAYLDGFNASGDDVDLPRGFTAGAADPVRARQLANDPTGPSGLTCGSTP